MKKSILSTCSRTITSSNFLFRSDFFRSYICPFSSLRFSSSPTPVLPTLTNFVVVFRFRIEYQHVYHSSGGTRYFGHFYVCGSEKILDFSCTVYKYVITIIIIIRALMLFFQFPFFLSLVSEISLSKIKLPHIRFFVIDKSGNFFSFSQ